MSRATFREKDEMANCAGDGKCGYTTRPALAYAYATPAGRPHQSWQAHFLTLKSPLPYITKEMSS